MEMISIHISLKQLGGPSNLVLRADGFEDVEKRKVKEAISYLAPEQTASRENIVEGTYFVPPRLYIISMWCVRPSNGLVLAWDSILDSSRWSWSDAFRG